MPTPLKPRSETGSTTAASRDASTILVVKLLGPPQFLLDDQALSCASRKAIWMAAYILMGKVMQPRARLAALFWSGVSAANALGSLRVALTKLPPAILQCLDVQRDAIGMAGGMNHVLDIDEFTMLCQAAGEANFAGDSGAAAEPAKKVAANSAITAMRRAIELYGGDLLEGVDGEDAPEFSDWLFAERNRLRQLAHGVHIALAQQLEARGDTDGARAVAEAWLAHDPANEAMHRLLINWLLQSAGSDSALAQFEVYRRALAVNHGAAPSASMRTLGERLRDDGRPGIRSRALPPEMAPATSFFGRDNELAALHDLLADPGCRLLTLHGLGGVGKTRLALAAANIAANEAAQFNDGVFVAALDGVASPSLFAQTVARACGLQPAGAATPLELLTTFFRRRNALLVLDNLEHLLQGAGMGEGGVAKQIAQLLGGSGDGLKILATSREPLRLQEEWLYPVQGLAYSSSAESSPAGEVNITAAANEGDPRKLASVQFFTQRARQAGASFSLDAELQHVVQICIVLQGLPLGIELAASWVGTVRADLLAAGVRDHAAALANRHANRSERHHSLGAAVSYSWERLDASQRAALASLAVMKGSFNNEAGREIGYADKAMLQALASRSLLERVGKDRWHMHEVVRQWAWSQPDRGAGGVASRQEVMLARRDEYYLGWLNEIQPQLEGANEPQALARMETESPNLRDAWQSAARHGKLALLEAAAPAWFDYLECRSFIAEGIAAAEVWLDAARGQAADGATAAPLFYLGLFQRFGARTAEALGTMDEAMAALPEKATRMRAQAHAAKAFLLLLLGRLAEAEKTGSKAYALAEKLKDPSLQASACRVLGLALLQSGRREEGRELQVRALELARSVGRPSLVAAAHNNLALAENHLGNYREAEAGYENALTFWREVQATANIGRGMHNLGVVATRQGLHEEALNRYRAALAMLRKAGDRNLIALNLMSTGDALLRLDRAAEAREIAGQALDMAELDGHMLPALDARIVLAQAAIALGEYAEAAQQLHRVLEASIRNGFVNVSADAIVSAARLVAKVDPAMRTAALTWAQRIVAMDEVSLTIRKDADALVKEFGENAKPLRVRKTVLAELASEAGGTLAKIIPVES